VDTEGCDRKTDAEADQNGTEGKCWRSADRPRHTGKR
jgi:hypothetical protein